MLRGQELPPAKGESWERSDIRVSGIRHPVHGPQPWSLQSQGCGQPGDYISLGHDFLTMENSTTKTGKFLF